MAIRYIGMLKKDTAEIRSRNGDEVAYIIENVTKVTVTGDYTSISYTDESGEQKRVTTNLPFIYNE